ncbi:MAG: sugar phosphate isomerase/epimerase family protein [Pseudomonadota bacterium]
MSRDLPLKIGAALPVDRLAEFRGWLLADQRDLEIQTFHYPDMLDGDWRPLAEEARRQLDGFDGRLGMHGPFWSLPINAMDSEIRAVVTRRLLQGLDICQVLGATQMVVHSPYNPWDDLHRPLLEDPGAWFHAPVQKTLGPVVARAQDQGVELVIENIQDVTADIRLDLVDSFGTAAVRASIDTGHAHISHTTQGAPSVAEYVRAAGSRLAHVHLQDTDGLADRHWPMGEGTIDWAAVFAALAEVDATPRLIVELRDATGLPNCMRYLEGLGLGV